MTVQVLGHILCPKVYGNPSEVVGAAVLMAQAGERMYARGATLVDDCLGAHNASLITLLDNAAVVQSNDRPQ